MLGIVFLGVMQMIRVKIKHSRELKKTHWKWFCGILGDSKIWLSSNPSNPALCGLMTREKFIKSVLKLKSRRQLRSIVLANYKTMRKIIRKHPEWVYKSTSCSYTEDVRDALQDAFGYKDPFGSKDNTVWNAFDFYKWMNIEVCPYCNSEPIGVGEDSDLDIVVRDQIEHFFPESRYPFLSITLFNMIPVCITCNTNKRAYDTYKDKMVYPYRMEFGKDACFFIKYDLNEIYQSDSEFYKHLRLQKVECIIRKHDTTVVKKDEIKNSIKKLKLVAEYNSHAKNEMKSILTECQSDVSVRAKYIQKLGFSRDDVLKRLSGRYINESKVEYPYRKLREDVLEQIEKYMSGSQTYSIL